MIIVVTVKESLDRGSPKIGDILLKLWVVKILPFFINVFLIKVVL